MLIKISAVLKRGLEEIKSKIKILHFHCYLFRSCMCFFLVHTTVQFLSAHSISSLIFSTSFYESNKNFLDGSYFYFISFRLFFFFRFLFSLQQYTFVPVSALRSYQYIFLPLLAHQPLVFPCCSTTKNQAHANTCINFAHVIFIEFVFISFPSFLALFLRTPLFLRITIRKALEQKKKGWKMAHKFFVYFITFSLFLFFFVSAK